jgi:hypothetical protein
MRGFWEMESGCGGHVLVAVIAGIVVAPAQAGAYRGCQSPQRRRDGHQPSLMRRRFLLNGLVKGITHVSPDCLILKSID